MSDLKATMTEMSGLFSNKKLNVVDESGSFVCSSTRGGWGGGSTRQIFTRLSLDFLKALRFSFPVPVVGPSAKVELSLSRSLLPQKT